ncbi:hypothetical protein QR213_23025, partial [Salmonella enterica]|nr:hypothetical protein [Salmonella enterica]MDL2742616.1 hypothetical protein [Salmonella enterica]MDL2802612.1 hypothetical protein [Salmonella enterica]MDL2966636.1 hypothetical protein [Salmonella enterica]MDL3016299.1 hypothetical protein [Salmonella enterica]
MALFPLLLALVWFAGSGIVSRINTEQQMNTIGQLTTSPALRASVVSCPMVFICCSVLIRLTIPEPANQTKA